MISAIPPDLEAQVVERAAKGASTRQISAWLLEAHGVQASHVAVARVLARTRSERADVTKVIVRTELGRTLPGDLGILDKHIAKLDQMADASGHDPREYRRNVEQLRKIVDTKLHYAGADQPDDSMAEIAAIGQRVASRLATQIAALAEAENPESDQPAGASGT